MMFAWTTFLLVDLLLVSVTNANHSECTPCTEYRLMFQEQTTTDYAIKEKSILYDLNAVTMCFFVRDNDQTGRERCLYSYAVDKENNELLFCISQTLFVLIRGQSRIAPVGINVGKWEHICFTWSNTNGDYNFYKDGELVSRGTGLNKGGRIRSRGTTVIGQDQDEVGGGFTKEQAFVGDVTEVNVWDTVLSQSDIVAQYRNCHIPQGSVNWWSQFADGGIRGGVVLVKP